MFYYHQIAKSALPRMKSSEAAHILYLLGKKALYSDLVVHIRHPLFIPCWLKYQFTRSVKPVLLTRKSNVTFFLACYPIISVLQSCESCNHISVKTLSSIFLLMIASNFSVITKSSHSVCTINNFGFYIFIFSHHRVSN